MTIAEITAEGAPAAPPARPADRVPLGRIAIFGVMALGMFMAILDIQIVAASLPQIQAGLAASPEEVSWIQTSYLIAEVIMIPISGYLSRALSTRIIFAISAGGFTLASFGCALSWNMESLIVMRALQGFLGGAMIPTVIATSFGSFPRSYSGPMSAATGLIVTVAPTIGPTLGGYITEYLSWHWLFLVNLIPGTLITMAVWLYADFDKPEFSLLKRFDFTAFIFMAIALGLGEYILEEAPGDDWFESRSIVMMTTVAAIAGGIFLYRSFTRTSPLVDFSAYRNRNFCAGSFTAFVLGMSMFGIVYLLPLYLARVRDFNSIQIGETLFATGLAMFLAAPVAAFASRKVDPRIMALTGLTLLTFSTWSMAKLTSEWGFAQLFWPQIGRGAGMMFCMSAVHVISLGTLDQATVRSASGLYNVTRNLGGALGLAIINTILTDRTAFHMRRLADTLDPTRPVVGERLAGITAMLREQGAPDPDTGALEILANLAHQQAAVLAYSDVIYLVTFICALTMGALLLAEPPKVAAQGGH